MSTKRRNRLTPRNGVECFEVRLVTAIDPDGALVTNTEITTPDGTDEPSLGEVLGALKLAEIAVLKAYDEA